MAPARVLRRPGTRRTRLGRGLFLFGLSGLVLLALAAAVLVGSLSAVADAATGFERQRAEIVAMLEPAAASLERAATSAENASTSLSVTSGAAARAATLTAALAESFDGLAALSNFELLGARPFAALEGRFSSVALESRALAGDLTAASAALAANVTNSDAVAGDLRALAAQLDELGAGLGIDGGPGGAAPTGPSLPILGAVLLVAGLLVWLAIPAAICTWLGWRLLRRGR